jgi:hypothetical protein
MRACKVLAELGGPVVVEAQALAVLHLGVERGRRWWLWERERKGERKEREKGVREEREREREREIERERESTFILWASTAIFSCVASSNCQSCSLVLSTERGGREGGGEWGESDKIV